MAFFRDFLDKLFGTKNEISLNSWSSEDSDIANDLWACRFAVSLASERIGALLSKCEFLTYVNGEEEKGANYYLLNTAPNPNQTAAEFKKQLVHKLITRPTHDALVVDLGKNGDHALYVADDFNKGSFQVKETYFKDVSIDIYGDMPYLLDGIFSGENAIYMKYSNSNLDAYMNQMRSMYGDLINNARKAGTYRMHYVLSMEETATNNKDYEEAMQQILDEDFKKFVEGENSVLPLYAGMKLNQTSAGADLGQNASVANKSVDTQVDENIAKVGLAFNLPKSVMLGDFEDKDIDYVLMFAIDPFATLFSEAFNRKWYGERSVRKGTYCKLDTTKARHYDLVTIASAANKVISSGIFTINEIRKKIDEPLIDPAIGDIHFITRNYAVVGDYVTNPENQVVPGTESAGASKKQEGEKRAHADSNG